MVLAFRVRSAASGRGLCDIDSVLFRVIQSRVKKLRSLDTTKINRLQFKLKVISIFSSV